MKELYQETVRETALNITRWEIDSIRKKNITKSGCRYYRDGFIGVAGTLGRPTENTWQEAEANLAERAPYPYRPAVGLKRFEDRREETKDVETLTREFEECLHICRDRYPKLVLSNKINLIETEVRLTNDSGTDLHQLDRFTVIVLLVKHIDSANVFDSFLVTVIRRFEKEKFLSFADNMLAAYDTRLEKPALEKPLIVIEQSEILRKLQEELSGKKIGRKASLFTDKIGLPIFSDRFSLYRDATPEAIGEPFFDLEGTVLPADKMTLIDHGVICHPYADKKNAADFGWLPTAGAGGAYDDVPTLDSRQLTITDSGRSLKELLNGEPGIYVVIASGGDFTSDGHYASPVQMAYLTDGERMLGRLPELTVSGSLYDIFGADFIGVAANKPFSNEHMAVVRMKAT
ncbi:MAG: metallopeptidase TldD-related protein [Clostridiaceae bacterium]|nr:metallopeptidase TldD-related protein [Clostridiaceae bacterium]